MKPVTRVAHTPGPWYLRDMIGVEEGDARAYEIEADGLPICYVYADDQDRNASLIVAAPDLLAYVERFVFLARRIAEQPEDLAAYRNLTRAGQDARDYLARHGLASEPE